MRTPNHQITPDIIRQARAMKKRGMKLKDIGDALGFHWKVLARHLKYKPSLQNSCPELGDDEPADAIDFDGFRLDPEGVRRLALIKASKGYNHNRPGTVPFGCVVPLFN